MFAYVYLMAAQLNVATCRPEIGRAALRSLLEKALRHEGRNPPTHLSEPLPTDDVKGVGPLMMAEAERLLLRSSALAD
ncbi:hypothetical protein [Ciceribacter azotifigens]|uniref:hypothetical protein n=1 Tax=Ciceribacter azotifigens TaxID=2069303 RepID=UPI003A85F0C0